MKDKYTNKAKDTVENDHVPLQVPTTPTPSVLVVPDITPLINVHLSQETLKLVKETVVKYPHRVDKIALYVNRLPQDQLKTVFSLSTF